MSAIFIALLAMLALGFALYPLFREERLAYAVEGLAAARLEDLLSAREATYGAIKDLEFDRAQGKLSDADYQTTRAKYENKAMLILQELNLQELRAAHARLTPVPLDPPSPSPDAVHRERGKGRGEGGEACANCGEPSSPDDKFCRRCGALVGAAGCLNCGAMLQAEWKFCKLCGTAIGAPACTTCSAAIQADWKFCKKCGAPLGVPQAA
jgi:RNA polymerase subunit RPABC4/transcription elongation factor Spt4